MIFFVFIYKYKCSCIVISPRNNKSVIGNDPYFTKPVNTMPSTRGVVTLPGQTVHKPQQVIIIHECQDHVS